MDVPLARNSKMGIWHQESTSHFKKIRKLKKKPEKKVPLIIWFVAHFRKHCCFTAQQDCDPMITAEEIKSLFLLAFSHFRICRLGDIFQSLCWYYCRYFSDFSVSYQKGSLMSPPLSPIWAIKHNPHPEDFPSSALQTLPCKLLLQEFFDRIRS